MTKEEFDALVAKVGEQAALIIKAKMEEAQKAIDAKLELISKGATKEELEKAEKTLSDTIADLNKDLISKLKAQGEAIADLKLELKSEKDGKPLTFKQALDDAFEDVEVLATLKSVVDKGGNQDGPIKINIAKAAIVMGENNTIGSGATQYTLTENTGIITGIRRRVEKYLSKVSRGTIGTKYAVWVEETDPQGVPIVVAEGAGKPQVSSKWIEKTASVKKVAAHGKVTTEMIADLSQLITYIKGTMLKRLSLATEDELFSGDGTGEHLFGINTLATAFSAGAMVGAVQAPNEFDVLRAIALQAEIANGEANGLFVHPSTWALMQALKDANDRPIWKDYLDPTTQAIIFAGMEIITTSAVTAGNFVGGDLSVLHVLFREEMSLQIGLDGNDFTNNVKTILAEQRLVQFASANDTPVLIKGDFATAKAALAIV